jgi:hypothetical protein
MFYIERQADAKLEQKLAENNYDAALLKHFIIPLGQVPYYNNSSGFESRYGQVEVNGMVLNYVKMRIHNDSLEVYCIPNVEASMLRTAKNDFFKLSSGLEQSNPAKKGSTGADATKYFAADYTLNQSFAVGHFNPVSRVINNIQWPYPLSSLFTQAIDIPPERC